MSQSPPIHGRIYTTDERLILLMGAIQDGDVAALSVCTAAKILGVTSDDAEMAFAELEARGLIKSK
jgi:hypothetical protein